MATDAQIKANQQNAQKSKGPTSIPLTHKTTHKNFKVSIDALLQVLRVF
jgi:hypothetical protein